MTSSSDITINPSNELNFWDLTNQIVLYELKDQKQLVAELTIENKNSKRNGLESYEVQKGDTLYSISKKFELRIEELKQKNNLSANTLSIGQKLIIK